MPKAINKKTKANKKYKTIIAGRDSAREIKIYSPKFTISKKVSEGSSKKNIKTAQRIKIINVSSNNNKDKNKEIIPENFDSINIESNPKDIANYGKIAIKEKNVNNQESGLPKIFSLNKNINFIAGDNREVQVKDEIKTTSGLSLRLYRKIAFSFIFFTILLLAVVAYFTFIKVNIIIIPNQERLSDNLIVDISDAGNAQKSAGSIKGIVEEVEIEKTKQFDSTGEEIIAGEVAGNATIINNYIKSQPLVATTRLLSPDNKIFRIKKTVNVPAGGSVEVEIYADDINPQMALGPTKFIIPGLWAGLQDKIYAENKEPIEYKQTVKKNITQLDIDQAVEDLKKELIAESEDKLGGNYKDYNKIVYKFNNDSISIIIDSKAGEEKESFSVTMKAKVAVIAFNRGEIEKLAEAKLMASLPASKELLKFDKDKIEYVLGGYNVSRGSATINASFEGKITLNSNADIIDKSKLLGLNNDQLSAYLKTLPEIASFEINFYPSFINKVPNLVDRINIEVKK